MIEIDASVGEGGGQIVRSALALSIITGKPVTLDHIRARRKNPGLQRQHLSAVKAAGELSGAGMLGATLHSSRLQFAPGPARAGRYRFDIGSAGSAPLVLQTVLLPLLLANGHSEVTVVGGTHNPLAPPYEFLEQAYLPQLQRMGLSATVELVKRGFYPAGGGELRASISPAQEVHGLSLRERGPLQRHEAWALLAQLPASVGQREIDTLRTALGWRLEQFRLEYDRTARSPGNAVLIALRYAELTELVVSIGARGKRAEQVAAEAAAEAAIYLESTAPVGIHLADQLLLPLGLAASRGERSEFRTLPLTQHSLTHIDILQRFLTIAIDVHAEADGSVRVTLGPSPSR
jgi:RNA 3'-terminal phosphate cyclase (ATP)